MAVVKASLQGGCKGRLGQFQKILICISLGAIKRVSIKGYAIAFSLCVSINA